MKKKITTVALLFLAICSNMEAKAQSSEMKHFTVGLGAAYDAGAEELTQNTKFDFNISPKFSIGIKNNLYFWDKTRTQVNPPDDNGAITTVSWRSPLYNNASLVGSYSVLGSNQNDKKFNLNVFAGLGWSYSLFNMDFTTTNIPANMAYIGADRHIDKTTMYLFNTGISAAYKLGPGKIYVELPVFVDLFKKQIYTTEYDANPSLNSKNTYTYKLSDEGPYNFLYTTLGFNLGYQINF